ncbi:hypothetical protein D3C76_698780 [compost metagenome]
MASPISWRASRQLSSACLSMRYSAPSLSAVNCACQALWVSTPASPITSPGPMRPASTVLPAWGMVTLTTPDSTISKCSLTAPMPSSTWPALNGSRRIWVARVSRSSSARAANSRERSSSARALEAAFCSVAAWLLSSSMPAACRWR